MRIQNSPSLQGLSSHYLRVRQQRASAAALKAVQGSAFVPPASAQNPRAGAPTALSPAKDDSVMLSASAVSPSPSTGAARTPGLAAGDTPARTNQSTPSGAATTPVFTRKDVERLTSAFGAATGDERFNAALDFNGDGVLNTHDLARLLARLDEPGESQGATPSESPTLTYTEKHIQALRESFGAVTGDDAFDSQLDLNNDGVLNTRDLAALLARIK